MLIDPLTPNVTWALVDASALVRVVKVCEDSVHLVTCPDSTCQTPFRVDHIVMSRDEWVEEAAPVWPILQTRLIVFDPKTVRRMDELRQEASSSKG